MNQFPIASADDVRRVEEYPYGAFMAHESAYDALVAVASRHGRRRALTYVLDAEPGTSARSLTYDELLDHIRRSANLFHKLAGGEQPRVAMLLPAIPEAYLTLWGAEAAGMICPINYLLDEAHIAELIRASGANILVALGPHADLDIWSRVVALKSSCPGLRHVLAVGGAPGHQDFAREIASMPGASLDFELPRNRDRIAALFHTGGTTGAPKLAQHTHGNQLHSSWGAAQMYAMDERDVILNGFPMFHVAGAFVFGLSALLSGAEIVLPTLLGLRNTDFFKRYWLFVQRHEVSLLAAVPTVIATLLGTDLQGASTGSVRALLTGGSPLPNELAGAFERKFGIPVRNILGMTECAGVVSIEPFHSHRTPGSCGIALPFTTVMAVRPDGRACEPGESGILRLRGPNVGPGYTDVRRNSGTFTDDGWLITGDIGHLDADGRVFVTGRAKDLIIRGAHNIDPQVIEEALLRHPDVLMAAAVGEPDEYAGELPVAFVSLRVGAQVDAAGLSSFANAHIPERPAYPKRIEILPAIPMTAVGKIYKPYLRALACEYALHERLARSGLQDQVRLVVEDTAKGLFVRFAVVASADTADVARRVADLMQSFAIAYSVDGHEPAPAQDEGCIMSDPIRFEVQDGIFTITLDAPGTRNALTPRMLCLLADGIKEYATDDSLRVAIITGAGERAFCAGGDLARTLPLMSGARRPEDEWDRRLLSDPSVLAASGLRDFPLDKPMIAAVNGACMAAGFELLLGTDIRICAEHATFALPEVKRALIPFAGSLARLPRQIPYCLAMEILLVGEPFGAMDAQRIGFVNRVVPANQLLETAYAVAEKIARNGPVAVRAIKRTVIAASGVSLAVAYGLEDQAKAAVMASEDAREGPRAFMEKRAAVYLGR